MHYQVAKTTLLSLDYHPVWQYYTRILPSSIVKLKDKTKKETTKPTKNHTQKKLPNSPPKNPKQRNPPPLTLHKNPNQKTCISPDFDKNRSYILTLWSFFRIKKPPYSFFQMLNYYCFLSSFFFSNKGKSYHCDHIKKK